MHLSALQCRERKPIGNGTAKRKFLQQSVDTDQCYYREIYLYSGSFSFPTHTSMRTSSLSDLASYDPGRLIDTLLEHIGAKNDFQLSQALDMSPSCISKIRNGHMAVSAQALIAMHEASGLSIRELRDLMGDQRKFFKPAWYRKLGKPSGISLNQQHSGR
jgi:hypothetical protein